MTVCLIVPNGEWNPEPLVTAIRTHEPERSIVGVWCGDPHRRPVLSTSVSWCDPDLPSPANIGWGRLVVAMHPRPYEWARTAMAVARLIDETSTPVTVLRLGSVAVLGDLGVVAGDQPTSLVSRSASVLPDDGMAPSDADAIALGAFSTTIAGFRAGAQPALRWLATHLLDASNEVGPWLQRMTTLFGGGVVPATSVRAVGWPSAAGSGIDVLDLDHVDRSEPWHLTFGSGPARVRLSADEQLADAVALGWPQCVGESQPLMLPGAIPVEGAVRSLMNRAIRGTSNPAALPPDPFGTRNSAFTAWLEQSEPAGADIGRYWMEVREQRSDLQAAFPQPQAADAQRFLQWTDASWRLEDRPAVLRGHDSRPFVEPSAGAERHVIVSAGFDPRGINVLGYLDFDQSQGHIAREIVAALRSAEVPVAPLNHHRSLGSPRPTPFANSRDALYATNVIVVNADQFLFVVSDHGDTLLAGRRTIAYWFWELEFIPPTMVQAIDHVDEIWTGSEFVAAAFRSVTDKPVRCVPLPVSEPVPSARNRASFGIEEGRFVFLATFDQFSVPERKNPFGVIDAFTAAFADGEGPLLWIKTMNGDRGWRNHERLLLAAAGRGDIVVWDEHLSRPDQMAVLAAADCLVSLHRSEGLGLHCAEAMWLEKPVIATRYSGNVDFMDDSCAALVGYDMVPVRHGEGIYPDNAMWADPKIDEAAAWMRRLASQPALADDLGRAARDRMRSQPSLEATGKLMADLAGVHAP